MSSKAVTIALLLMVILSACANVQMSEVTPPVIDTDTPNYPTPSPTLRVLTFNTGALLIFDTPSPAPTFSPSPTVTVTPTLDYAALGLPSPTPTPTFDYEYLAAKYLTPFTPWPTKTGLPSLTPTANIPNMLSSVVIRRVSPQPPPLKKINYEAGIQDDNEWMPAYVQTVTDLMNYTDGDKSLYIQYIEAWVPTVLKYSANDWFLEDDYDDDGQLEWLVSVPVRFVPDEFVRCGFHVSHFGYCPRFFFIFEKINGAYYPKHIFEQWYFNEARVALVEDMNNDGVKEIVFRADPCGAAVCSTDLAIGKWNGHDWEWHGHIGNDHAEVTFIDIDGNGTVEIKVAYPTYAASRYNSPYSRREVVDIYGWKNNRYEIVDQIYPPTDSVFELIFDINRVLEYRNAELAMKYAIPVVASLDESCDRMKTYIGTQAMLAYALQEDSNGMKSTLAKLETYCSQPNNAYTHAARILWLSYEETRDPIRACQAMERFLSSEYTRENGRWIETLFIDDRLTNRPSCPRE
jgi:hypothetical protein